MNAFQFAMGVRRHAGRGSDDGRLIVARGIRPSADLRDQLAQREVGEIRGRAGRLHLPEQEDPSLLALHLLGDEDGVAGVQDEFLGEVAVLDEAKHVHRVRLAGGRPADPDTVEAGVLVKAAGLGDGVHERYPTGKRNGAGRRSGLCPHGSEHGDFLAVVFLDLDVHRRAAEEDGQLFVDCRGSLVCRQAIHLGFGEKDFDDSSGPNHRLEFFLRRSSRHADLEKIARTDPVLRDAGSRHECAVLAGRRGKLHRGLGGRRGRCRLWLRKGRRVHGGGIGRLLEAAAAAHEEEGEQNRAGPPRRGLHRSTSLFEPLCGRIV
ncbi:MAG: hypothetical protein H6Q85_2168 [candidate division NC10 bacterium]|nr:hypothetical protein [candidate division NC10 bacterium]